MEVRTLAGTNTHRVDTRVQNGASAAAERRFCCMVGDILIWYWIHFAEEEDHEKIYLVRMLENKQTNLDRANALASIILAPRFRLV